MLTAYHADWQIHLYENTVHAFTNILADDATAGILYNENTDKRAWRSITDFLDESM